ncbi:MAG: sulfite exporter TauE/SafE family protein [Thermoleophilaceae bacterium]|nr:sulfite exporter TauE/SafE family protein [Thermoleophilaceae bacterium]
METTLIALPFGLLIGALVGAVGGGGAILALPVLVYVLGQGTGPASTAALIVVAVAASVGASLHLRDHQICWRIAVSFILPSAAGAFLGAVASVSVSPRLLLLTFVGVLLSAAALTWSNAGGGPNGQPDEQDCPRPSPARVLAVGLAVGLLTGFFGVGGGFLLVPGLTVLLGVPIRRAIATSLVLITATGAFALLSHLGAGAQPDWTITGVLGGATAVGALLGVGIGRRLPTEALSRAFAIVVVAVAALLLVDVLVFGGPPLAS